RPAQHRAHAPHFARPAAHQNAERHLAQGYAHLVAIDRTIRCRNILLDNRMPDADGLEAFDLEIGRFEIEQADDAIVYFRNLRRALWPPCPDRWRNVMDQLWRLIAHLFADAPGHAKAEVRGINSDNDIGPRRLDALHRLLDAFE